MTDINSLVIGDMLGLPKPKKTDFTPKKRMSSQERTKWLNDTLNQYIPPELKDRLNVLSMLNPVNDAYQAMGDARDGNYASAAVNTLGAAAPALGYAAAKAVNPMVDDVIGATVDTLTGMPVVSGVEDAARRFAMDEYGGLKLYHGTNADFDAFDPRMSRTAQHIYTTPIREDAAHYGKNVMEFDVDARIGDFRPEVRGPAEMQAMREAYSGGLDDYFETFDDFVEAFDTGDMYQRFASSSAQDDTIGNLLYDAEGARRFDGVRIPDAGFGGSLSESVVFDDPAFLARPSLTPAQQQAQEVLDLLKAGRASQVTDDMMAAADDMYLFNNYDLPMDEASRMARAREMGFDVDTDLLHGTTKDFPAFDADIAPRQKEDPGLIGRAIYTTGDPKTADLYSSMNWRNENLGAQHYPVMSRAQHSYIAQDGKLPYGRDITDYHPVGLSPEGGARWKEDMISEGHDAVTFRFDVGGEPFVSQQVDFNPANIRSRFARFDPRLKHLRNLSAAGVGLMMMPQEDYQ